MRILPSLVCITLLAFASAAFAQTPVQQWLTDGQTAYMRGDMETAKARFENVRSVDPANKTAIGYLKMIRTANANLPKGNPMEKQLAGVIIPKVEFRDATLEAALTYLKQSVTKVTDSKVAVNFVMPTEEAVKNQAVSLSLSNIPVTEVLRYLGGLANVQFEYDKYAIVVKPKGGAAAPVQGAPQAAAQ